MAKPAAPLMGMNQPTESVGQLMEAITRSLQVTSERLTAIAETLNAQRSGDDGARGAAGAIQIWEDDPFSEVTPTATPVLGSTIVVDTPTNMNGRMRTAISEPRPAPARFNVGTREFRYWVAEEALLRGIAFWGSLLPAGTTWSSANPMPVQLVSPGADLNAFYARAVGLKFFRGVVRNQEIFSGESPDIVLHELGHAVLDALKPQLFHVANTEADAFHEAFGDMSAILCCLQLKSMRTKVLVETSGKLNVNSRLSRVAEQLGWAIRQRRPSAVDHDSLRNAANSFKYVRPDLLDTGPLTAESHSFSRVFTGAFLDALGEMFKLTGTPNEANLLAVSRDMGQLLVDGVHTATIVPAYFSQVAAAMVQADKARFGGRYKVALTRAFVNRQILSVASGMSLADAPEPNLVGAPRGAAAMASDLRASDILTYDDEPDDAYLRGPDEAPDLPTALVTIGNLVLHAHVADQAPRFAVMSAAVGRGSGEPLPTDADSNLFVDRLIQLGQLDLTPPRGAVMTEGAAMVESDVSTVRPSKLTHVVVSEGERLVVKRDHFNCGICRAG